ncbi:MAG: glycosyl hydrolase family 17 protein [Rhodospirillaceae bacterium]
MQRLALFVILLGVVFADFALWALPNRPFVLEPPLSGKLMSVSFAPFRNGQSPLTRIYPDLSQIDADLRTISDQVAGVRTYTSIEGMEDVPALARKYGLTVIMGAWLSAKAINNDLEIRSLIKLANTYPDVIKRVIVGNEVLLRGDLTQSQLTGYINRVRAAIKQPVSTADVWEYWLRYPDVAESVDFITIHLLPYWENEPAGVDTAGERILSAYRQIAARFPGKPILVGEAGWPTEGRTRGPAVPGIVNKARFDSAFMRIAAEQGFDYNLIEAFDQNWKIKLEGTVGGKWGLFTADRALKYKLAGPVIEDARWPVKAGLSSLLGLALLAVALRRRPMPAAPIGLAAVALLAILGQGLAAGLVHATDTGWSRHYYAPDLALDMMLLALQVTLGWAILVEAVRLWSRSPELIDAAAPEPTEGAALAFWGGKALTVLTALAILWTGLLIGDGRYRDFPVAPYLVPSLGMLALTLCRAVRRPKGCDLAAALSASHLFGAYVQILAGTDSANSRMKRSLCSTMLTVPTASAFALLLPAGAVGLAAVEGWQNHEAMVWAGLLAALTIPHLAMVIATMRGTEPLPPVREL